MAWAQEDKTSEMKAFLKPAAKEKLQAHIPAGTYYI